MHDRQCRVWEKMKSFIDGSGGTWGKWTNCCSLMTTMIVEYIAKEMTSKTSDAEKYEPKFKWILSEWIFFNYRRVLQMMRIWLYDSFDAPSGICRNFISRKEFIWKLIRNVGKIFGIAFVVRRPALDLRSRTSDDVAPFTVWCGWKSVYVHGNLYSIFLFSILCACAPLPSWFSGECERKSACKTFRMEVQFSKRFFFCLFYIHSFVFHLQMQEHLASMLLCASVLIAIARKMKRRKK